MQTRKHRASDFGCAFFARSGTRWLCHRVVAEILVNNLLQSVCMTLASGELKWIAVRVRSRLDFYRPSSMLESMGTISAKISLPGTTRLSARPV